jgi:arabinogalactan oligomer/maltooligosaccharide transport system substrate-binding protein
MLKQRGMMLTWLVVVGMILAACGPAGGAAVPAPTQAPVEEATVAATPATEEAAADETPTEEAAEEPAAEATEAPATEGAAEEGAAAAEGEVALTIWADDTRSPVLSALGAEFEEQYGLRVVVTEKAFDNIRDDFKVAAPTGEGPDIIIGAHDWLGELVENGLLAGIELGEKNDQFLPAAVQAFVYDGTLYGLPYATENVAFVYNTEMVTEVPTTWTEVAEVAAELQDAGTVEQGYIIQETDPYHFFPIQTAFGGYIFGLTDEGYNPEDIGLDSEGSIAAATWLDMMYKEGHLTAGSAIDYDLMHAAFNNGEAAMMITGPWALPTIRESGIPYAVTNLPGETQEGQPFLGVQGFMVSAFSDDVLLAQTFLQEFVATDETMQAIFEADPRPSAYLPVRGAITDEDIAAFAEAGANGLPMPAIPEMSAVWSAWGDALQLIAQQTVAPDEAFANAAEQVRTAIAGE